ncbi:carbohydrate sulfotransferase 9-like [Penaeus chinensis]|uniref:carbohydrate sulfotransferase 9-like n=1 Tax=Penaeus chinensis TaxID=139456 RepID=UPI001FB8476F|nr:carbohydrate sulfotransferase 9-like [Penaeus chinensis]
MFLRKNVFRGFALLLATTVISSNDFLSRVNGRSSAKTKKSAWLPHLRGGRVEPPTIVLKEMKERRVKENQASRSKRVREMCTQYNVTEDIAYTVHRRHYYFFDHNATVCAVPKAGSSTWRVHVREVNGGPPRNVSVEDDKRRQTFLQSDLRQVVASTISSSTLIMSVRHPLTRLVSAYRNKYDDGRPMRGYNREMEENKLKVLYTPRWNENVHQFWIPAMITNGLLPQNVSAKIGLNFTFEPEKLYDPWVYLKIFKLKRPVITFVQFLRHVIASYKNQSPDNHWKTSATTCSPCTFPYEYIVKTETFNEDMGYVFGALKLPSKPKLAQNQIKSGRYKDYKDFRYYKRVSQDIRRQIYDIFKIDFEMFGYKLPPGFLKGPSV